MNRKLRRQLVRNAKMAITCAAAFYLAIGVKEMCAKGSGDMSENKTAIAQNNQAYGMLPTYEESERTLIIKSRDWSDEESYLLAKMAMAIAETEDVEGKALVIQVILNRVWSDEFPDTIEEVIYQYNENTGVYQFSPMRPDGNWDSVEPNNECWEAVRLVQVEMWDESQGATYFENDGKSEWHKKNLKYLFQHGNHCFYTDKENW